jgi:hypothetical protein
MNSISRVTADPVVLGKYGEGCTPSTLIQNQGDGRCWVKTTERRLGHDNLLFGCTGPLTALNMKSCTICSDPSDVAEAEALKCGARLALRCKAPVSLCR